LAKAAAKRFEAPEWAFRSRFWQFQPVSPSVIKRWSACAGTAAALSKASDKGITTRLNERAELCREVSSRLLLHDLKARLCSKRCRPLTRGRHEGVSCRQSIQHANVCKTMGSFGLTGKRQLTQ
jgi:hypothetical protein